MLNAEFWKERRVLLTGHTGFKGSWLALWLETLGAKVAGLALAPETEPNLYSRLGISIVGEIIGDIRDRDLVARAVVRFDPQIVIHMAAQALVQPSYSDPVGTFASNVMGVVHLLEASRGVSGLQAVLIVTTDKVYENREDGRPFVEHDRLGGRDPYSSSKACAEFVTRCYRESFYGTPAAAVATARAGNVVGGGDWSAFRLVPDVIRSLVAGESVVLRQPGSVRPWQHVLEPLCGYLLYAEALAEGREGIPMALNFAPAADSCRTAAEVVEAVSRGFGGRPGWTSAAEQYPHEARTLALSAAEATATLGWQGRLDFPTTMAWTADWYRGFLGGMDARALSLAQIAAYSERAQDARARVHAR